VNEGVNISPRGQISPLGANHVVKNWPQEEKLFQDGDVRLTYHIYKLSFMNFLLGKQPNGPGQGSIL
jgi:hypothetical protein